MDGAIIRIPSPWWLDARLTPYRSREWGRHEADRLCVLRDSEAGDTHAG